MNIKKILLACGIAFGIYAFGIYIYFSAQPAFKDYCPVQIPDKPPLLLDDLNDPNHKVKTINDASCLNETRVYDIISVKSVEDIKRAIKIAQEKKIHISVAGVRHSMGGQAFFHDALVLDMTSFNEIISLDEKNKILKVQSGATWHQ